MINVKKTSILQQRIGNKQSCVGRSNTVFEWRNIRITSLKSRHFPLHYFYVMRRFKTDVLTLHRQSTQAFQTRCTVVKLRFVGVFSPWREIAGA